MPLHRRTKGIDLYRELWSRFGGKPWTYITRRLWKEYEFFWIVGLISVGMVLGRLVSWKAIILGWVIFTIGYILGHIFWSTTSEEWRNK